MQLLQPLKKLNFDEQEFFSWLGEIPEPERKRHSLDFLITLFVVEKALEVLYGGLEI